MFNKAQKEFINRYVQGIDFSKELTDDDYIKIEDMIGDIYTEEAQNNPREVSDLAKMCESILDALI